MNPSEPDFRALYEAHVAFVWRCLRRFGIREADLMDVTQKVFMTAFVKRSEYEGRGALTSWLFGIAKRVASDYRRSAPMRREVATDQASLDHAATFVQAGDPAAASESRQHAALAEAILDKLPEPQRTVFVLFELEDLSGEEIAEALNVPLGTVRSRLRLAREAFRREVKRLSASRAKEAV